MIRVLVVSTKYYTVPKLIVNIWCAFVIVDTPVAACTVSYNDMAHSSLFEIIELILCLWRFQLHMGYVPPYGSR